MSALYGEEVEGWIWILHTNDFSDTEEDNYDMNTIGAYKTFAALKQAADKMGLKSYSYMHILVEDGQNKETLTALSYDYPK